MNALRDKAFDDFKSQSFPTRKVERYKYSDMQQLFEPDYGLNINRLDIPVDPYQAFKCDVPNLSTLLYFVVNDAFYTKALPKGNLPEGVVIGSLSQVATEKPELVSKYYGKLAKTNEDAVTALNTMLAQDGLFVYVPKNVKVDRTIQVINTINQIMNNDFVPQMKKMLANKNLIITDIDLETDWVYTSYVGLWIENPDWKYFAIAIEFERRWLKDPIIGFHRKEEYKREDIKCWDILKERYSSLGPTNPNWIYKRFKEQYDWHTPEAIDKIANGRMVKAFEEEIDEILKCAKEINEI